MVFSQKERGDQLATVFGTDKLFLVKLDGTEEISGDFEWHVEAISSDAEIDLHALLGTHATVSSATQTADKRYFDGIVTEARALGNKENGNMYAFTLRPWLHIAGLRRNQRIFHNMTVVDIVTTVLDAYGELGAPNFKFDTLDDYPTLEYTVQYNESDADFCRRLLERFGISWYWEHSESNHTMIMVDSVPRFPSIGLRPFYGVQRTHANAEEHFHIWEVGSRMTTGAVRLTEYNFKRPHATQEVDLTGDVTYAYGNVESFDWPGDYLHQTEGHTVVERRVQEEKGQGPRISAKGNVLALGVGNLVQLAGDLLPGQTNETFVCLKARHALRGQAYGTQRQATDEEDYTGDFVLMPDKAPMRPQRRTRVPKIQGPQTATVVGEGEIDCDRYGRILVHFPWDLDAAISMRCRVSQNWASKGWGGMVIPRIGMEVLVEFLDGDPDKPIVVGCIYNGQNDPPYDLPEHKTKSVFRTDTHKGEGYNELMFEDEKDKELIYMKGQKDQQITIANDRGKDIGRDQFETVGRDKTITVAQDHSETIGRDKTMTVGKDHVEAIGANASHTIGANVTYTVGQNQIERYGKDHVHYVGNIHKQEIFADHLIETGRNHEQTVLGTYTLDVNQSITNNTGTHTLTAFQSFVIKGPGGKITIDASGVTIEALRINLVGMVNMGGTGMAMVPTLLGAANDGLPLVEECAEADDD